MDSKQSVLIGENEQRKTWVDPTLTNRDTNRYLRTDKECVMDKHRLTIDSQYVKQNVGDALIKALADVCEKRPHDPIEYIAHFLYKYRENEVYQREQIREYLQLMELRHQKEREDDLLSLGRPEAPEPNSLYRLSSIRGQSTTSEHGNNNDPATQGSAHKEVAITRRYSEPRTSITSEIPGQQSTSQQRLYNPSHSTTRRDPSTERQMDN